MASTVLVVDDDPDVRQLARVQLQAHGYAVKEASHGHQALEILLAASDDDRVDLVLLDVNMPGMDGVTLLRELRDLELPPPTTVVMFTGAEPEDFREQVLPLDVRYSLRKPYTAKDLVETVQRALETR